MTPLFQAITSSLAPGIALSAVIFYNTSLQTRFIALTGRMRERTILEDVRSSFADVGALEADD